MNEFEQRALSEIANCKSRQVSILSPLNDGVYLQSITHQTIDEALVNTLCVWRKTNQHGFTKQFNVTLEGTEFWLNKLVMDRADRVLFKVFDNEGAWVGHMGLSSFDFTMMSCELDNVVRGEVSKQRQVMHSASLALLQFTRDFIRPKDIFLRVLNDNVPALALYSSLGFVPVALLPLEKQQGEDFVEWVELDAGKVDKYFVKMLLSN